MPHPEPPGFGEVVLRVGGVSVCGSDVHQYHNTQSWAVNVPVILGHEFGGTVAAVGSGVHGWREGDRVVSETAAVVCGECALCRTGRYNLCPHRLGFGYGVNGAMAEFVRVPARCLHRIPDSLPFERAALTEPCCVAYNAVVGNSDLRLGDLVVVLGPGPIGLLCLMVARLRGAGAIVMAGLPADASRLEKARALGADHVVDGGLPERMRTLGDGLGADLVIDATGASASLSLALEVVRPGGQITKVGWGPQPFNASLDPLVAKAVTLHGSFSHNWPIWEKVIGLLASGQLDVRPIISRTVGLPEWQPAFEAMATGEVVKAVLIP